MKGKQRIISICLVLCIMLSVLSMQVLAEKEDAAEEGLRIVELSYASEEGLGSTGLYEAYARQLFYSSEPALYRIPAGDMLSGDEKVLYDALVPYFRQIANGERASATITVGQRVTEPGGYVSEVDVAAVFSGEKFTSEMLSRVVTALMSDMPYDCYWYDKTSGCGMRCTYGSKLLQITLMFTVANNYRGADEFTADPAKTGVAKLAAANAKAIVDKYADVSDYEKLMGYKNEICALVSYDNAAAGGGYFDINIDPWQLISVFDGNSSTNVVCEGYAKAFMYLCEITDFNGSVSCYNVMGHMNGTLHMWNIVEIDGKYYLADVTNSDTGTSGAYGGLFLAGAIGSVAGGYRAAGINYVYDNATKSLWGTGADSILTLQPTDYDPATTSNMNWSLKDGVLTISGKGRMEEYGMHPSQPWYNFRNSITSVVIEDGITSIGRYAFYGCNRIESIVIPDSIKTINDYAFYGCSGLISAHYLGAAGKLSIGSGNEPLTNVLHNGTAIPSTVTCETAGTEGGLYCETCGMVVEPQAVPAKGHSYQNEYDPNCDRCGEEREIKLSRPTVNMFRMYDPNSGEHFYTGSEVERENLIAEGWQYEGVGFTFPLTTGAPVHRLYDPVYGEHLYTMDEDEMNRLLAQGWNYEGVAFNSGFDFEVPQYRLHNPNEKRGAYHFTSSTEERDHLLSLGWEFQGIGWYSCWK